MQFIAVTRRRTEYYSPADFAAILDEEAHYVKTRYAEGTFRSIHSRGDMPGAVIGIEASDREAALAAVLALPLAKLGMLDLEIIPLMPYRAFVPAP